MDIAWMLLSLAVVFGGSRLFTNGIEHVGRKLRLRHSTTGSLLASLGTDLPESIIALWAIFLGTQEGADVAMGAIVGAPLLLTTLALAISGAAALYYAWRRRRPSSINGDDLALRSDLSFFLLLYPFVGLAGLMPPGHGGRWAIGMILVGCYVLYAYLAVQRSRGSGGWEREDDPRPLYLTRGRHEGWGWVLLQAGLGLGFLVGGAHLFVEAITATSQSLGVSPFLLSVFITPLATELPETLNSIIWLGEKKDTLALGNITGAMVLQSSLVPAIGIFFTPWVMGRQQLWAVGMALLAGALVWGVQVKKGRIPGASLILNGLCYGIYGLAVSL